VTPVRVGALESGQLSGHCGLRVRIGAERRVANDPDRTSDIPRTGLFINLDIALSGKQPAGYCGFFLGGGPASFAGREAATGRGGGFGAAALGGDTLANGLA
jgi:hypothetical protein